MSVLGRLPRRVQVVEVGPRDGLQNEATPAPTTAKVRFVDLLARAGLRRIEATSFVSPKAVPQLADAAEVMAGLRALPRPEGVAYSALVPNARGLDRALAAGVDAIAVFTGATDAFTRRNINMTVRESLEEFAPIVARARAAGLPTRGYISVCFGCPYSGAVEPAAVLEVARRLLDLGCDELSLGDTIGVATPGQVEPVVGPVVALAGPERVAVHFHDTSGAALANALTALLLGVTTFDASAGGLGGCPYAPGATGNLATEDLLYMLHGLGIETGVDLDGVAGASRFILGALGRPPASRRLQAILARGGQASPDA
jgi:isopropylmalate/homocitrate/citramalate synthase